MLVLPNDPEHLCYDLLNSRGVDAAIRLVSCDDQSTIWSATLFMWEDTGREQTLSDPTVEKRDFQLMAREY